MTNDRWKEAALSPKPGETVGEALDAPSEDRAENIVDNPKSWIAWKREAENHLATIAEMWVQFDRLRDATNRKKCGQAFMVGGHHIAPWGIVDHAISALDLSMMRADRIKHEQSECEKMRVRLSSLSTPPQGNADGVKVKPLEWTDVDFASDAAVPEIGLSYTLQDGRNGWFAAVTGHGISQYLAGDFAERDSAKAAAQADYETRILSALTPSPISGEVAATVWHYEGELAIEWPGRAIISIEGNGVVSYAVCDGEKWTPGSVSPVDFPGIASDEINAALSTQPTTQPEGDGR